MKPELREDKYKTPTAFITPGRYLLQLGIAYLFLCGLFGRRGFVRCFLGRKPFKIADYIFEAVDRGVERLFVYALKSGGEQSVADVLVFVHKFYGGVGERQVVGMAVGLGGLA